MDRRGLRKIKSSYSNVEKPKARWKKQKVRANYKGGAASGGFEGVANYNKE